MFFFTFLINNLLHRSSSRENITSETSLCPWSCKPPISNHSRMIWQKCNETFRPDFSHPTDLAPTQKLKITSSIRESDRVTHFKLQGNRKLSEYEFGIGNWCCFVIPWDYKDFSFFSEKMTATLFLLEGCAIYSLCNLSFLSRLCSTYM